MRASKIAMAVCAILGVGTAIRAESDRPLFRDGPARTPCVLLATPAPGEVADAFTRDFAARMARAVLGHPRMTMISERNLEKFCVLCPETGDYDYPLEEGIRALLRYLGRRQAPPKVLVEAAQGYMVTELEACLECGQVTGKAFQISGINHKLLDQCFAEAAFRQAANPAGLDLRRVRQEWLGDLGYREERQFLYPVKFQGEPRWQEVIRALGMDLDSDPDRVILGDKALQAFADSEYGLEGSETFAPLQERLREGGRNGSLLKCICITYSGDAYFLEALLIVDQHQQAWGLKIFFCD